MEIRDFFTETEIRSMKERIVRETCLSHFLVKKEYKDEDGVIEKYNSLDPMIKNVIQKETEKEVRDYVREVVKTVAKERVAASVDRFSEALCKQLDEIAKKTCWYWSIKS